MIKKCWSVRFFFFMSLVLVPCGGLGMKNEVWQCSFCGDRDFKSKGGLANHERLCSKKSKKKLHNDQQKGQKAAPVQNTSLVEYPSEDPKFLKELNKDLHQDDGKNGMEDDAFGFVEECGDEKCCLDE